MYANQRSSNINMGLDYDSTVMLTFKLLFAAAKAIVDVGPHICPGVGGPDVPPDTWS